ncbi:uncharacterized protein IL334_006225 [Kwoniella shivajii]|uniref:Heme oxygenase 2 n=1 Tax=Kwoniella shivajii TaxID=564305 RepID=A0ABZ1D5X3_9TREE|nr:hypothetical protein IL334_006225 [Kwoniella shivajii]
MQTVISDKQLHLNSSSSNTSPAYTPSFSPNTPTENPFNATIQPTNGNGKTQYSARGGGGGGGESVSDELDLSQPVSTLLRLGTQRAHVKAEHSAGAAALVQGGLGLDEYIRWLAVLWRIYDALELGLSENSTNPVLAPTYDPALLARAPALAEDINYLLTLLPSSSTSTFTSTSNSLISTPLPPFPLPSFLEEIFISPPEPLSNYLHHVKTLSTNSNPNVSGRLLAHAYVRYLGDLSGGQFIGAKVKKSYNLKDKNDRGTKFYYFEFQKGSVDSDETKSDAKKRLTEVKDWYRRGMDEGVGEDKSLKSDLVEEANIAFSLNTDLFSVIRLPSSSPSPSSQSTNPHTSTSTKVDTITPKEESTLADKVNSVVWFLLAAGAGVLLNIYVQPYMSEYMSGSKRN